MLALLATSALADNNFANVVQTGEGNDGAVTQGPGTGNRAGNEGLAIRQSGNRNVLTFLQSGSDNRIGADGTGFLQRSNRSTATITQTSSNNNVASMTQTGIASARGGDGLRRNVLAVTQETGDGNGIASVVQTRSLLAPGAAANSATLTQSGAANQIGTVFQSGYAQTATLTQRGDGNAIAASEQRGSRNVITLALAGDDNGTAAFVAAADIVGAWGGLAQGRVYQNNDSILASPFDANELDFDVAGNANSFGFSQVGGDNTISGVVAGDGNQTGVNQLGLSNTASFALAGADNLLFIDQGLWPVNYANAANVVIAGDDNHVGVRQGGSSNSAGIAIGGGGNLVNVTQESLVWGNDADIAITGSNNRLGLTQEGRNTALLAVTGGDNLLAASQLGSLNTLTLTIFGSRNNALINGGFTAGKPAAGTALSLAPPLVPGDVRQSGAGNAITYTLGTSLAPANDNKFAFWQNGDGNVIEGFTRGSANEVAIIQNGNANFAYFSQNGVGNVIGVSQ